jgi:hypothetical protein
VKPALTSAQAKTKDAYLRKNYNITLAQYNELREFQNYACYICQTPEAYFKNGMAVDHRHAAPATVRGLLCWKCNRALGKFEDNAERLSRAANYISFPPTYVLWGASPVTVPGRIGSKSRNRAIAKLNGTPTPKRRKTSEARAKRKRAKKA